MCEIVTTTLLGILTGGGAATAAGATAGAATAGLGIGGTLQTLGALAAIGGTFAQGVATRRAANAQADAIDAQRRQEARLNSIKDQRTRKQFASQIRDQAAQIAARGFSLDSPTAIYLGQTAAEEMAFASQSVRQDGAATDTELTNSARQLRAQGRQALFKGGLSAAGTLLSKVPELWPELLA